MNKNTVCKLMEKYGDAFYILDTEQFKVNFSELKKAFTDIYSNFNIAYSYKTNYTPKLCGIVNELGGYAEVVSDMELEIALKVGVEPSRIIWNGPYKNLKKVESFLLSGGTVNIDSGYELRYLKFIADKYKEKVFNLGLRCNFDINDGVISRFGFDVSSDEFKEALTFIKERDNVHFAGLQCHFATRRLETWRPRAEKMLDLIYKYNLAPEHIDLGGGLFGKMKDSLKSQFDSAIPSYQEYAETVAPLFAERYSSVKNAPILLIEPGSALVGDCMKFVTKVINIKTVRGKAIATLLGSIYNINPTLNKKNPPIQIIHRNEHPENHFTNLDFGGYTCIESDYLYRSFSGRIAEGDIVVFDNVGSYSVVLKPPFILPNFPVVELSDNTEKTVKAAESFDDLFHTFNFG
ncbi:MAG: pyridoxal-dependent decarboxylase [Clostridia bacterium]|jgi:diaminopimelate decarboxylase|nr:pyridoxal-dependent decarboxylase [Clostridia bacterium]